MIATITERLSFAAIISDSDNRIDIMYANDIQNRIRDHRFHPNCVIALRLLLLLSICYDITKCINGYSMHKLAGTNHVVLLMLTTYVSCNSLLYLQISMCYKRPNTI